MRQTIATLLTASAIALMVPEESHATKLRRLSLEELRATASQVVVVTIEGSATRPDLSGRMVWTDYSARVLERLSGEGAPTLTLSFAGGVAGGIDAGVIGVPVLESGATYVLFLSGNDGGATPTLGWGQGLFRVVRDLEGQQLLISGDGESLRVSVDGTLSRGPLMQVVQGTAVPAASGRRPLVQRAPAPRAFDAERRPVEFSPARRSVAASQQIAAPASLDDLKTFVSGGAK